MRGPGGYPRTQFEPKSIRQPVKTGIYKPPSEAAELGKLVENFTRAAEAADLAERIKRLEQMANNS